MEYRKYIVYAMLLKSADLYHIFLEDGTIDICTPQGFKNLYIGITGRTFEERMKEHQKNTNNMNHTTSKKLYDSLRFYNFESFEKIIIADELTEREAKDMEIYLIDRFDSYINGLNSNPGGGSGLLGGEHPNAIAVQVYNNNTEEITHFDCQSDAAKFLGIFSDSVYAVTSDTNNNQQTFSIVHNAWFQIRRIDDDTPFIKNMQTPREKISGINNLHAIPIQVYNNSTEEITYFDCQRDAAKFLGVDYGRIKDVTKTDTKSEQTFSIVHNAWFQIRCIDDDTPFIKNMLSQYEKLYQPIIVFDIDSHEELFFDGSIVAARYFKINVRNIGQVISGNNKQFFANGHRYDVQKKPKSREWNMHLKSTKTQVYYIDLDNHKIIFNSINEAVRSTRNEWGFSTQKKAIKNSINSNIISARCKAGYKWYSGYL
jgi:hypothetical protein